MGMVAKICQTRARHKFMAKRYSNSLVRLLIILLFSTGVSAIAEASYIVSAERFQKPYPEFSTLQQTCKVGIAANSAGPAKPGETSLRLDGITTTSVAEAKCVIDTFTNSVLVIDAASENWIKDSFPMGWAARSGSNDETQQEVERVMGALTNKRDRLPIIVYCHHVRCGLSPEVARRIRAAGYGPVLWMREGIEVWLTAGYPTTKEVSRWLKPPLEKIPAWQACYNAQKLPATGSDYEKMAGQMMNNCLSEEAAYRATLTPYFLASQVEGSVAGKRKAITMSGPNYDRFSAERSRREDVERDRKRADYQAQLSRMRGVGIPAQDRVAGYEICWVAVDSPEYQRFFIYSNVYPAVIGKTGMESLSTFNQVNSNSERGLAFVNAVKLPQHLVQLKVQYSGQNGCYFYRSSAEADAARTRMLQEPGGRSMAFSWQPQ